MVFQTDQKISRNTWGCLGEDGRIWQFWPGEVLHSGGYQNSVHPQLNFSIKDFMDIGVNKQHGSSYGIVFG